MQIRVLTIFAIELITQFFWIILIQRHDDMSFKILFILKSVISAMLSNLINKSMQLAIFPDKLTIAKIISLHKEGKPDEVNNYRPISILSSLSKNI